MQTFLEWSGDAGIWELEFVQHGWMMELLQQLDTSSTRTDLVMGQVFILGIETGVVKRIG